MSQPVEVSKVFLAFAIWTLLENKAVTYTSDWAIYVDGLSYCPNDESDGRLFGTVKGRFLKVRR